MRYLGNIIVKHRVSVSEFFNVTDDISTVDTSIPTLIVGWSDVKEMFPEQNILNYSITPTISWTFSKKEKRYQFEKDIVNFTTKVIQGITEKVNYHFFNYVLADQSRRNSFFSYVSQGNCSIYHNARFLYIYNIKDKLTIGVSLTDLRYIGMNIKEFIQMLNINQNNLIVDNLNFISQESFILLKDNVKSAAYLYYLKNSDIYKENLDNNAENYQKIS